MFWSRANARAKTTERDQCHQCQMQARCIVTSWKFSMLLQAWISIIGSIFHRCKTQTWRSLFKTVSRKGILPYSSILMNFAGSLSWLAVLWGRWMLTRHCRSRAEKTTVERRGGHTPEKNCENGPMSGQSGAELLVPWKKFMIEGMNRTAGLKFLERTCCVSYECLVHTIVLCGGKI